jgi:hypothetical protein
MIQQYKKRRPKKSKVNNGGNFTSVYKVPVVTYPKWVSINLDDNIESGGYIALINEIAQGSTNADRIGNRIMMGHIEAKLTFAPSATDGNDIIRIMIVEGYNPLVVGDFPDVFYPFNFNKGRVLHDKTVPLNIQGSDISVWKKYYSFKLPLNKLCQFESGTQDSVCLGKLYLYMVSDSLATPYPTASGAVTLFFRDLN